MNITVSNLIELIQSDDSNKSLCGKKIYKTQTAKQNFNPNSFKEMPIENIIDFSNSNKNEFAIYMWD